ncbi:MAG TPA: hypothetical protein VGG05_16505 [Pseudonocardiaceae bacterium]|jgi:hypothetical protein
MPELPVRPDLGQLRRQAHELLRAATAGQRDAMARLHAVSPRIALSTAQLALAREYGFPSWAALSTEVRRRRSSDDHWSLGGGTAVSTAAGLLRLGLLRIGSGQAVMDAELAGAETSSGRLPVLDDIPVTDQHGSRYALHVMGMTFATGGPAWLSVHVEPVPARECGWLELRGLDGSVTRLVPSPGRTVSVGVPAPLSAAPVQRPPSDGDPTVDAPRRHLDLTAELPPIDDATIRLESLFTEPDCWRLYLRATPGWWRYSGDGNTKWTVVSVTAEDDRGSTYAESFGGSSQRGDHEAACVRFLPALDPLAGAVTLTFRGTGTQITVHVDLEVS